MNRVKAQTGHTQPHANMQHDTLFIFLLYIYVNDITCILCGWIQDPYFHLGGSWIHPLVDFHVDGSGIHIFTWMDPGSTFPLPTPGTCGGCSFPLPPETAATCDGSRASATWILDPACVGMAGSYGRNRYSGAECGPGLCM